MAFRALTKLRPGLLRDTAGNTLALMAAAMVPLVGMAGGAVDMSRLYLVKTRLQQACDAGALAARRTMAGTRLSDADRVQASNFFKANLKDDAYGASGITFAVSDVMNGAQPTGRVSGRANARVPMAIMNMFGIDPINMEAVCEAELNVTNNDVLFVLDVTGSMSCLPADSGSTCDNHSGNTANYTTTGGRIFVNEKPGARIQGLRAAVKSFFTTLDEATTDEARLRIGFLPYSSGVNVAGIMPTGTMLTGARPYESRVANMATSKHSPSFGNYGSYGPTEQYSRSISSANCANYGNNVSFTQDNVTFTPTSSGNPTPAYGEETGGNTPANRTQREYRRNTSTYDGNNICHRQSRVRTVTYTTRFAFTNWTYRPVDYTLNSTSMNIVESVPTTARVNSPGGPFTIRELAAKQAAGTASGLTVVTRGTDGCVEERLTGQDDIHGLSTSDETRWAPTWRWLTYLRGSASNETTTTNRGRPEPGLPYACPKAARQLAVMTQAEVDAYVDGSSTEAPISSMGYTYHDIGMTWAARMMSQTGVFSASHTTPTNGRQVARHIIFMTDGEMKPQTQVYSPFGPEYLSRRRQPTGTLTDSTLRTAHNTAFRAACAAARQNNVTVWVVAFGQALTPDLIACADDETRDFTSTDTDTLNSQFQSIARRIAELRLSQ